ncbi:MAG: hypothetical protein V8S24_15865 [Gordonibacter pamelaeae]
MSTKSHGTFQRSRRSARATPSDTDPVVECALCGYSGSTTRRVQPASFSSRTASRTNGAL